MNREIKFRGQIEGTNQWVYGNLFKNEIACRIIPEQAVIYDGGILDEYYTVDIETVAQFTGLTDKNGKEIYEGDILKNPKNEIGKVIWEEAGFHLECKRKKGDLFIIPLTLGFLKNKELIGNVHKHKNLLDEN